MKWNAPVKILLLAVTFLGICFKNGGTVVDRFIVEELTVRFRRSKPGLLVSFIIITVNPRISTSLQISAPFE